MGALKENTGQAGRRQLLKKLGVVLLVFFCAIGALVIAEQRYTDSEGHLQKGRRKSLFKKLRHVQRTSKINPALANTKKEYALILTGGLNLIDIDVSSGTALRSAPPDAYDGVTGTFCKLNWGAHKYDPSSVPMFRDVLAASPACKETSVRVPLKEIATLARKMDEENERKPTDAQVPKPLNFTGIVFHESRCGSTLVANTLIATDPSKHRVYSESPPPVSAMKVCGDTYEKCSIDQAAALLKDVLYMMGRTNDPKEERVFFKIQSVGSHRIEVFRRAFPTTPWLFVYREPVQVMMSHLKKGTRSANCMRSVHRPPVVTQQLVQRHGYTATSQLDPEEFCAAHLATITETALTNLQETKHGIAVNYENLPNVMYETVLPEKLGVAVGQPAIDRIEKVSEQYSKGRGDRKKIWTEDSEKKEQGASSAIREAATNFMLESYNALQELSVGGKSAA